MRVWICCSVQALYVGAMALYEVRMRDLRSGGGVMTAAGLGDEDEIWERLGP